jgi:hypothetical protein
MKFISLVQRMIKRISGNKAEGLNLLQQQSLLLYQGRVTTAEVIETSLSDDKLGTMLPVRLWLKLKTKDENFIYTHTITLVSVRDIPVRGQTVTIKYLPDNLSSVLILH